MLVFFSVILRYLLHFVFYFIVEGIKTNVVAVHLIIAALLGLLAMRGITGSQAECDEAC